MKELAIGEELRIRCAEDKDAQEGCNNCVFADGILLLDKCAMICSRLNRTDGKNVHFELVGE